MFIIALVFNCEDDPDNENLPPISDVFEAYYQDGLKLNPLNATFAGDNRYNDTLPNSLSKAHEQKVRTYYTTYREKLSHYDSTQALSDSEQLTKAILHWDITINLEGLAFENYTPIDQMWSMNLMMGQLASGAGAQPFKTVKDYENWLSRLEDYTEWLASTKEKMEAGIANNHVLPKSLTKKVIPQLASVSDADLDSNLFMSPIKQFPNNFSDEDKNRLKKEFETMVEEKIKPSYAVLKEFMASTYLDAGRESSGIDAVPNGDTFYQHQIKLYTTTDMTADEIHQLGLSEVARIRGEMSKIKEEVGFTGDLKAFFDHVRTKPELMPFKDPSEIIASFNDMHERMKPQIVKLFDVKPKTAFEVRRTEAFREASASAEYNPGSLDGSRPGIFYTPIPDVAKYNMFSDESLFLHEAIPGHHYQISLQQEDTSLPSFRKTLWYGAYGEGWALYSESLGKELGLLTDPYQYFGMLSAEMHRAIRLVVDTGLHSKGWSREKAIQYSLDNEAESEASITSEIERYMANPGQALSYKIGQLKIRELRTKAENELGDDFDIRQFHNQVLQVGCVPLSILEERINNWIAENK
ncbi:DUF885 domain-containing protein [Spongiivirga citrea]|nr:DUF885 domain-containing protein [Spongiivirga citrea]